MSALYRTRDSVKDMALIESLIKIPTPFFRYSNRVKTLVLLECLRDVDLFVFLVCDKQVF